MKAEQKFEKVVESDKFNLFSFVVTSISSIVLFMSLLRIYGWRDDLGYFGIIAFIFSLLLAIIALSNLSQYISSRKVYWRKLG